MGNSASWEHKFYVDVTPPQVELLTPPDGTVVTGVLDIWGNVTDISLLDWTLTATGSSGKVITVWTDTAEKTAEQLGVLDTGEFADGKPSKSRSSLTIRQAMRAPPAACSSRRIIPRSPWSRT